MADRKLVRFIELDESQLSQLPLKPGTLIYTKDSLNQYLDTDTERIQITDLIVLANDSEREDILVPLGEKFYYIKDTKKVWMYDDGQLEWYCLNETIPEASSALAGLMSVTDKAKLDGIENNANNYIHPKSGVLAGKYNLVTVNDEGHITEAELLEMAITDSGIISKNLTAKDASITIASVETPINELYTNNFNSTGVANINELVVAGNLTVKGESFTVESTTVTTKDNIIQVNAGEVGPGVTAGSAGLSVDRGSESEYLMVFDEADDMFKVGMKDDLETIATRPWVTEQLASKLDTTAISNWAKAPEKPTYTKEEIGLDQVDNTADANKNVATAKSVLDGQWSIKVTEDGNLSFLNNGTPVATLTPTGILTVSEFVEK